MNSRAIIENATGHLDSENYEELVKMLNEARINWECACAYFDFVSEPKLVDYAIYNERAALLRYSFLISEIKKHKNKEGCLRVIF